MKIFKKSTQKFYFVYDFKYSADSCLFNKFLSFLALYFWRFNQDFINRTIVKNE